MGAQGRSYRKNGPRVSLQEALEAQARQTLVQERLKQTDDRGRLFYPRRTAIKDGGTEHRLPSRG